jgi:hypothetical protein
LNANQRIEPENRLDLPAATQTQENCIRDVSFRKAHQRCFFPINFDAESREICWLLNANVYQTSDFSEFASKARGNLAVSSLVSTADLNVEGCWDSEI